MKLINSLLFLTIFFLRIPLYSQTTPMLYPEIGETYDFSQERQDQWITCDSLMLDKPFKEKLTRQEFSALMDKCAKIGYSEACDDSWSIICGNDWTDEGYAPDFIIDKNGEPKSKYDFTAVSSALKSQSENTYDKNSICDLNYKTAWVEGVNGYGIGETVDFKFKPDHPRITTVIIANGYIKDKNTWKNNSRVKQLKMYLNDKHFAILNLEDVYAEQMFEIPTIGYKITRHSNKDGSTWWRYKDENGRDVKSYHENSELKPDNIRFEILSVYKGEKYKDTGHYRNLF